MRLQVDDLSFSYEGDKVIVKDIFLHVKKGEFVGLIGPNGSGKSTLLKNIYRALKPSSGVVLLDGEDIYKTKPKKTATKLGVVGQENAVPFDFTVQEIVAMGRSPHKRMFDGDTQEDYKIINHSLVQVGMLHMAQKNFLELSGGEKQRVIIARVLAQETDFLLLDEPTNHLDIRHQLQIFDLVKSLGITSLAAIHDLNLAALYCDRIYVMKDGVIVKDGIPTEVLTAELLQDIFGVRAEVMTHPLTNKVGITYLPASIQRDKGVIVTNE